MLYWFSAFDNIPQDRERVIVPLYLECGSWTLNIYLRAMHMKRSHYGIAHTHYHRQLQWTPL